MISSGCDIKVTHKNYENWKVYFIRITNISVTILYQCSKLPSIFQDKKDFLYVRLYLKKQVSIYSIYVPESFIRLWDDFDWWFWKKKKFISWFNVCCIVRINIKTFSNKRKHDCCLLGVISSCTTFHYFSFNLVQITIQYIFGSRGIVLLSHIQLRHHFGPSQNSCIKGNLLK